MKRLILSLLLCLSYFAAADPPDRTPSGSTASSTLSNVDPDTGRDNLGVGDYFAGNTKMPLAVSRVWKDGRAEDQRPPLTVMLWGDSLMDSMGAADLFPQMNFLGWKLFNIDRSSVTAGTAPNPGDGTWLTPDYRSMAVSSTVEWIAPQTPTNGIKANRVGVLYYKGASSSAKFTVEYQQNGGAWTAATTTRGGGSTTSGSPNITFTDSGCVPAVGSVITNNGTAFTAGTYIVSATGTTAVMSTNANATESGRTFTISATIDTSKAAANVAWAEYALSNVGNATKVRVTTTVGETAKVIGAGAWFGDTENFAGEGGWVLVDIWKGGISPTPAANTANSTPTAISAPFAAMQINMVIGSWFDIPSEWDTGSSFDDVKEACDAGLVADWVMITPNPMDTSGVSVLGTGNTPDQDAKLARTAAINWAVRQSQNVIDLRSRWGSWANAKRLGVMSNADSYHPTAIGKVTKRRIFGEIFSNELSNQKDAWYLGQGPGGRKVYATSGAYAIKFAAEAQNPLSTLLWYFQGNFQSTGTLAVDGATTLNGALIATPQSLASTTPATAAVNTTTATTHLTTTGAAHALSLANGTVGQRKTIIHVVDGGSAILTPTTKTGFTTITFTNAGESVTLEYTSAGWVIVAIQGAVAA